MKNAEKNPSGKVAMGFNTQVKYQLKAPSFGICKRNKLIYAQIQLQVNEPQFLSYRA